MMRGLVRGLRSIAARYLDHGPARFLSVVVLGFVAWAAILQFRADARGVSGGFPPLGADFAQFYAIGALQREAGLDRRLYDFGLQDRFLHEARPRLPAGESLPFVYPPLLAVAARPLSLLPYRAAFAVWIALGVTCFAIALTLTFRRCADLTPADRVTAGLLAASFAPIALETILGGQLSFLGTLAIALAIWHGASGRDLWSGACLALMMYKPTLLVLILPALVVAGRVRVVTGFLMGVVVLAIANLAVAGWGPCREFLGVLAGYGRQGGSVGDFFRTSKYVDIGAFLKLLGLPSALIGAMRLGLSAPVLVVLAVVVRLASRAGGDAAVFAIAAVLCWTPVLNVYGPVYDVAIIVPGLLLAADALRRTDPATAWPIAFRALLAALSLSTLAAATLSRAGVQPITPALAAMAAYWTWFAARASRATTAARS